MSAQGHEGVRAGIVVTGTEVLTGRVADRNGPWLAERLLSLGIDVLRVDVVGDRPEDLRASVEDLARAGASIVITSGGLGPTADDLTADVVAEVQGRSMRVDEALEGRIAEIVSGLRRRPGVDPEAVAQAVTKQARVPDGATVLEPVGTAPGLVVPPSTSGGATVVVLPGPPRELQGMWDAALASEAFQAASAERRPTRTAELRLFGIPESEIAATLRAAEEQGVALDRLEVTTCMRRGEIEVVTRFAPDLEAVYDAFEAVVRERHADTLFSDDGSSVDELVARGLDERGWTIATAESCTGGLLAGRLTAPAGASARVLGGLVVYANEAKTALAGVPASVIESVGAVSEEVAEALADGARERLEVDVGVGITGIAGPGGGSEDKPVGTVCFSVAGPDGRRATRRLWIPGDRADVRDRSTTVAMHLVLALLRGDDAPGVSLP